MILAYGIAMAPLTQYIHIHIHTHTHIHTYIHTEFPKPHRLPFYAYLDPRRQRRELRALKALQVEPPNPHPRNPETGKPIEPAPTKEELEEQAQACEAAIKEKLTARLTAAATGAHI